MNKIYKLILVFLFVSACNSEFEEEISWKLDDYPDMLVIESTVTNELKHQSVYLTVTAPYFSTDPPEGVSGAEVTVSDGVNTYSFSENEAVPGLYFSDEKFRGVPLQTYTLRITLSDPLNGTIIYEAESTMPAGLEIESIICEVYAMPEFGFGRNDSGEKDTTLLGIYYFGKEPDDPDNYYLAKVTRKNGPWQTTAKDLIRFSDDNNNGSHYDFILLIRNVTGGDTIGLELSTIDKKYYDYIGSIQQMDQSGSAYNMSGPPANAVGNIPNALGFFTAIYVSKKTGIAVDKR